MIAGASTRPPASTADLLPPALSARLDALDVLSRRVFAGKLQGERRSKRRGRSIEFEEHREYVPGDDLRHIDWNVYARLDRFFIKLFQEEEDLGLEIVLDASASMHAGSPSKLLFAARLAAALGYTGLVRNNRVSLTIIGLPGAGAGAIRRLNPLRGRRSVQRFVSFLLEHAFAAGTSAPNADPELGPRGSASSSPGAAFTTGCRRVVAARQGKGIVVLLSDLLIPPPESYQPGLRLLAAPSATGTAYDVHCLQILSPGELDPAREGRADPGTATDEAAPDRSPRLVMGDLALTDVETGRVSEVTVTPDVLDAYRRAAQRFVSEASAFCRARSASHLILSSDADVATVMLESLRRGGLLT
ncbi:MAG: DUF58 domain-containing protein [Phycisphaerales bacterium]